MKLYPFQETAVAKMLAFMQSHTRGCYNACEQGLGKTIQTITVLKEIKAKRVLIICPAVMKLVWRDELAKWGFCKKEDVAVLSGSSQAKKLKNCVVIMSYNIAHKDAVYKAACSDAWDVIVLDEAHYVKNRKAKRTKAILGNQARVHYHEGIWDYAKYRIALSGTPFTNSVTDGWTIFNKFCPDKFPTFDSFAETFCYAKETPWGIKYHGIKNHEILSPFVRANFYIRYTQEEVLPDLPPITWNKITLAKEFTYEPEEVAKEEAAAWHIKMKEALVQGRPVPQMPGEHMMTIRKNQGLKKVSEIIDFAKNLLDANIPIVLFGWFKEVIEAYKTELIKYNPVIITGASTDIERYNAVQAFQNGDTNLFIGNLKAAGEGITLTRSSNVLLAEFDYSPATISQAVKRCHRIGTKSHVNVYFFVPEDSPDSEICEVLMEKAEAFAQLLEN